MTQWQDPRKRGKIPPKQLHKKNQKKKDGNELIEIIGDEGLQKCSDVCEAKTRARELAARILIHKEIQKRHWNKMYTEAKEYFLALQSSDKKSESPSNPPSIDNLDRQIPNNTTIAKRELFKHIEDVLREGLLSALSTSDVRQLKAKLASPYISQNIYKYIFQPSQRDKFDDYFGEDLKRLFHNPAKLVDEILASPQYNDLILRTPKHMQKVMNNTINSKKMREILDGDKFKERISSETEKEGVEEVTLRQIIEFIIDILEQTLYDIVTLLYNTGNNFEENIMSQLVEGNNFDVRFPNDTSSHRTIPFLMESFKCPSSEISKLYHASTNYFEQALRVVSTKSRGYLAKCSNVKCLGYDREEQAVRCEINLDLDYDMYVSDGRMEGFRTILTKQLSQEMRINEKYIKIENVRNEESYIICTVVVSTISLYRAGWGVYQIAYTLHINDGVETRERRNGFGNIFVDLGGTFLEGLAEGMSGNIGLCSLGVAASVFSYFGDSKTHPAAEIETVQNPRICVIISEDTRITVRH